MKDTIQSSMGNSQANLSRKSFLQLAGAACLAGSLPHRVSRAIEMIPAWPMLDLGQIPGQMQAILQMVPQLEVDAQGFMTLQKVRGSNLVHLPRVQTQWNLEHSHPWDRLERGRTWGIVLHWYGDEVGFDRTVEGYLRGFNELRKVADYITRTSAHFVVGAEFPKPGKESERDAVTILQTQFPDLDGTPFTASHLQSLDYTAHAERRQYFVRALYELGYREPTIHSILQDWFDGPPVDANMRSLAIELTGCFFDTPGHAPTDQQIANAVGVTWALMRRYGIRASNILGHHEISLDKSDPGKPFMALIRCLLGVKALTGDEAGMNELVFSQHLANNQKPIQAVRTYFRWVRDYLALVSRPSQVSAWDEASGYWLLVDRLATGENNQPT